MYFGRANAYGPRYANFIIQNADYILTIGARLGVQHTGYNVKAFGREAFIDMVDLDKFESKKYNLNISRFTKSDAKKFLEKIYKYSNKIKSPKKWIEYCVNIKKKYPTTPNLDEINDKKFVDPYYFYKILSNVLKASATVALGSSGTCFTVSGQVFESKKNQTVFHAKGMAAMGFGIPSSIGSCFAKNKTLTITVVGDGGFQLNIQELQTIIQNKLPIKIFVLQNNSYHAIRVTQDVYFNSRYIASSNETGVSTPSLKKIAKAYDFKYSKINNNSSLTTKLKKILNTNHPEIIEIIIDPKKHLLPKLGSILKKDGTMISSPLEDLHPLMDRQEFLKNMLIKPIKY
jgi:acetolactate synthase-1/2/3 large subunit